MSNLREHPRPQLVRAQWQSLDGRWDFALDREGVARIPAQVEWSRAIEVPFAPETPRSGVNECGFFNACWYRRTFVRPALRADERLLLHFGAVDHRATIWVNGSVSVR